MPIYEYTCEKCGTTFEQFVRLTRELQEVQCPKCHGTECRKAISLFGHAFNRRSRPSCSSGG